MDTLMKVPFLAIIFGDEPPTLADSEMLQELYADELGPNGEFEVVHYERYQQYGHQLTSSNRAAQRDVKRATKQVVVMMPRGCSYQWMAIGLSNYAQQGVQFKAFFRP